MTKEKRSNASILFRKLKRRLRKKLYHFLLCLCEGNFRISYLSVFTGVLLFALILGFFLPVTRKKAVVSPSIVLGDELSNALTYSGTQYRHPELLSDCTVFLLPELTESTDLDRFLSTSLYGFYLTGKELTYLPELSASLSSLFGDQIPYIGGLSYQENSLRIRFNRTSDVKLHANGSDMEPEEKELYYVVGNEAVFSMFHLLSERTYHLLNIQPKDRFGSPVSDFSKQLLLSKDGSYTLAGLYRTYLSEGTSLASVKPNRFVTVVTSLNTAAILSHLNPAGFFVLFCFFLIFVMAVLIRPYVRRIMIWIKIYRIRNRKRGGVLLRLRLFTSSLRRRLHGIAS